MSNDISYVVKVQDRFSKNTKKFSQEIDLISKKVSALDGQLRKIQGNLNISVRGSSLDANAVLRPLAQIQQKLKEFSYGSSSTLGKVQRANQHIIKSNKELAQSFNVVKNNLAPGPKPSPNNPSPNNKLVPAGNNISLGNVAKAMGFYKVVDAAARFPADLIQTRREMDSLGATLEAILPQYDKTKTGAQLAAEEFDYLAKTTYRLGVSFNATKDEYVKFLAASAGKKDSLKDVRRQFEAFASLSRLYGIAPYRFQLIMNAMVQMKSKGKIMLEELQNQLGESLPGAIKLFADALGMSEVQFRKLLNTTGVSANVLKTVAEAIFNDKTKIAGLGTATNTLDARINKLNNSWTQLKITLTEGDASELISDTVSAIDLAIRALTVSVSGLGQAWSDLKKGFKDHKAERYARFHPEIARDKALTKAQSFDDYIKQAKESTTNMSLIPQGAPNSTPFSQQETVVKVMFENAPPGMRTEISRPSSKGNLGVTTGDY